MGVSATPACFGSTRNSERPSGDRAGTSTTSATCAHGTKRFTPESAKPSPARVAVVFVDAGSQSSASSSNAALARAVPAAMRGQPLLLLRGAAAEREPEPAEDDAREIRSGICRAAQLLQHERQLHEAEPGAALLLGEGEAEPAELGHLAPEIVAVALGVVHHLADVRGRAALVERRADGVLEENLVVGEREVHRAAPARSARASLGRPRMRSPITFFWISLDPA